ncbi:MAG: hypothetical protein ABIX36_20335 [Mucilaginibacter sp.]
MTHPIKWYHQYEAAVNGPTIKYTIGRAELKVIAMLYIKVSD